eukprot:2115243-Rhodomonas_salina.1
MGDGTCIIEFCDSCLDQFPMTDSKCHRCAEKRLEINSHVQPQLGLVCLIGVKKRGGEYDDHS